MMSSSIAKQQFPLHWLVWHNNNSELDKELQKDSQNLECVDPRGRTSLHLAVTLGHLECARTLLRHGANANAENSRYWTVLQEAVSTGDPELVQLCLQYRDYQRSNNRTEGVPALLQRLREAPDFYVEMKWEFTSWVPLVSRMCPSDTYKVWKCGSNVRIDTTLLGFDNMNWQRGSRSYVFKGNVESATVMEIDHDSHSIYSETMRMLPAAMDPMILQPSEEAIAARLTTPIVTTFVDTEKIEFERSKSGIWGWRSDKNETVNTHDCKVFCATNVELITKTRTEHLTEQDKKNSKKSRTPIESFLGIAEQQDKIQGATANGESVVDIHNPCHITPEEYFDPNCDLNNKDIGRPKEQSTKTQKFKAQLWLCERYPLSLQEQVGPIIDLMAATNAHFRKLKDFITLQLPAGFPVKIEIPLFHVLNARITFGNIYASDNAVDYVCQVTDNDKDACVIDDSCFDPPATYMRTGDGRHVRIRDEDDELLQFALQQSLIEAGTENDQVTFWEALNKSRPSQGSLDLQAEDERILQRAIEESMNLSTRPNPEGSATTPESNNPNPTPNNAPNNPVTTPPRGRPMYDEDEQLRLALELSQHDMMESEHRRTEQQREEDEELERIIQLSLTEK